jgi:ubiquinone/menaquinone biosynthesis C-methylase UbiE
MTMSNIDPSQFKQGQRESWDSVAAEWQKWWKTTETAAENVSRRLIELAEIKQDSKVLDIATGIGEPAITAAKKMGNGGHVLATDISPQMLSIAKQRAISLGMQNIIEFREGDAETIDLPTSTFNAELCRFGLMFLPDLKTGLSNLYRSLVHGGRLAAAVWASPDKVPFIALALNTVMKETNSPQPPPGIPGPFSLSDENILKDSFVNSRFTDINIDRINVVFNFDSAEDYTNFVIGTAAPIRAMVANETPERREEVLKAVTQSVRKYADNSNGTVKLSNEAICIVGRK